MELLLVIVVLIVVGWVISRLDEWRTVCWVDDWWNWLLDKREAARKRQQNIKDYETWYQNAQKEYDQRVQREKEKQK